MAWPYTYFATFIDSSTPYVDAAFLNALQTATNDLYTGAVSATLRYEDWAYFIGTVLGTRWKSLISGAASSVEVTAPTADFPWSNVYLHSDPGAGGYVALHSGNQVVRAHATLHNLLIDGWYGINTTGSGYKFWWGWMGSLAVPPVGTSHRYALFQIDSTGTFWQCVSADATAEQSTTTAIAFPTALTQRARLRIQIVGTSAVKFYIDGVLVATHSTRVPTGTGLYVYMANDPTTTSTYEPAIGPLLVGRTPA